MMLVFWVLVVLVAFLLLVDYAVLLSLPLGVGLRLESPSFALALIPASMGIIAALLVYFGVYSWWTGQRSVHLLVDGAAKCGSWVIMQGTPTPEGATCQRCRLAIAAEASAAKPSKVA